MIDFKFEFDFNLRKLEKSLTLYTGDTQLLFDTINRVIPKYRITSPNRLAGFIDQYEYKTRGFVGLDLIKNIDSSLLRRFSTFSKIPADKSACYYATLEGALDLAGWFWNTNYLNIVSDNGDIENLTKRINPLLTNTKERFDNYNTIQRIFKDEL